MPFSSSIVTRLHYQHKSLIDIIDGLSDEKIRRQLIPGKWSIFENIVHLQTYQHAFCARMKRLLEGDEPIFTRYTAEADPMFLDNCHKETREIIQDLLATRKKMLVEITSVGDADTSKVATHPVFGKLTMAEWLNFFLLHEAHHMFTVFRLAGQIKNNQ
jgi:uncharacterized damage-inducible protein DinB